MLFHSLHYDQGEIITQLKMLEFLQMLIDIQNNFAGMQMDMLPDFPYQVLSFNEA